jgi:hypothetical protein
VYLCRPVDLVKFALGFSNWCFNADFEKNRGGNVGCQWDVLFYRTGTQPDRTSPELWVTKELGSPNESPISGSHQDENYAGPPKEDLEEDETATEKVRSGRTG